MKNHYRMELRFDPIFQNQRVGESTLLVQPLASDVPTSVTVDRSVDPAGLSLVIGYRTLSNEPREERVFNTVRVEIGKHSGRVFAMHLPTPGVSAAKLESIAQQLNEAIRQALSKLANGADRPGRRVHYEIARDTLSAVDAPPAWMVDALRQMRGDSRRPSRF